MGLVVQFLKFCVIAASLVLQGYSENEITPSPATSVFPPPIEAAPGQATNGKQLGIPPSPLSQQNGSDFLPPLVSPPSKPAPAPQRMEDIVPSLSPPHAEAPDPSFVPKAPVAVPVESPPKGLPQLPVPIPPIPGSMPPSSDGNNVPDDKAPVSLPTNPAPIEVIQSPPPMPQVPAFVFPVPSASPPKGLPQLPLPIPAIPRSMPPSSNSSDPVQIAPTPRDVTQSPPPMPQVPPFVFPAPSASPPKGLPQLPLPIPAIPRSMPPSSNSSDPVQIAPTPRDVTQSPPPMPQVPPFVFPAPSASPPKGSPQLPVPIPPIPGSMPPSSNSSDPVQIAPAPKEVIQSPLPLPQVPAFVFPVPRASPPSKSPLPPSVLPEPSVPPISAPPPSVNSSSPANGSANQISPPNPAPKKEPSKQIAPTTKSPPIKDPSVHNAPQHSNSAPPPAQYFRPPPAARSYSPASLPSPLFNRHHPRKNITAPLPPPPSSYFAPPPSTGQVPFVPSPPLYPPTSVPKSSRSQHDPPVKNPEIRFSPAPSTTPSVETPMPLLPPKISPSGSPPRTPKRPYIPAIHALPPPPPNEDCSSITCVDPQTNTPPGAPCGCVLPMKIGLRLSVALYTFFPLVSELAMEIATGVFMSPSQVRIMGANAASQDPEKTTVLIDLVPLGEKFDSTTAYLTAERFWQKQVAIKAYFFGDYEVLYLQYPGLPPSPPLPPSTINIIDGEPLSGRDHNGRTIKPLGVDVSKQRHRRNLNGSIIAVIVISASVAVIFFCAVAWLLLLKRRNRISQQKSTPPATQPSLTKSSGIAASTVGSGPMSASLSFGSSIVTYNGSAKTYSLADIEKATDNFNASRVIGEGGFGRVYSGVLEDGTKVAVKVLKRDDQQGGREFLAEVEMLSRLHHRNLVKLIGLCSEERMKCLVYELIPNGSVESHLHGVDKDISPLDWASRLKIALGSARALAYLHEDSSPRVIHRDFKASNILLEHDFMPKVSDFGLARTALDEENKHISTRVMGTFGYVAPEYAMTGHLLVKSDVYSYGVVLLELLTGRKPVDMSQPPGQENLVTWTRPLLTIKESLESIIDPSLGPTFPYDSIAKVAAIASMCVQPEVSHRPFMGEVVQALKLVCNECEETKDLGSRICSQEDLSIDFSRTINALETHSPISNYDVEQGISMSELHHHSSARFERVDSDSFRRHSSSGPLRTGRKLQIWERMKRLSGGSVSEHGVLTRLWPGSH